VKATVITDAEQCAYRGVFGESIHCAQLSFEPVPIGDPCLGRADVEITWWDEAHSRHARLKLCRVCAGELIDGVRECLDLLDARQISSWMAAKSA
jgi:hypothetical protein